MPSKPSASASTACVTKWPAERRIGAGDPRRQLAAGQDFRFAVEAWLQVEHVWILNRLAEIAASTAKSSLKN